MPYRCPAAREIVKHLSYARNHKPVLRATKNCASGKENSTCPAAKKIYRHLHYLANIERGRETARLWREANPERVKAYYPERKEYFSRPEVKAQMAARGRCWAQENREKVLRASEAYRKRNKGMYAELSNRRRTRKLQATPAWLNAEQWAEIRSFYERAAKLTQETGIRHEVDHIIPLQGKTICGLHVPWNLQVITMVENRRKSHMWHAA